MTKLCNKSKAHDSVFISVSPVTKRLLVKTPLRSFDVVCCPLKQGTWIYIVSFHTAGIGYCLCWELTCYWMVSQPGREMTFDRLSLRKPGNSNGLTRLNGTEKGFNYLICRIVERKLFSERTIKQLSMCFNICHRISIKLSYDYSDEIFIHIFSYNTCLLG